jgi:thiosulfate reductase cytochrome b subunit
MKKWNIVTVLAYITFMLVMVCIMLLAGVGCAALMDVLMGFVRG